MGKRVKIIFISSSGRSGSKSLAHALALVKDVHSFHCPFKLDNYNCHNYMEHITEIRKKRSQLIKSVLSEGQNFIESSNCLLGQIKELAELYPDCVIVHLVRDGRDFVRSGFNRPWYPRQKDKFGMICRLWAEGQRMTIKSMEKIPTKNCGGIVRLEDLIKGDIGWFLKQIGLENKVPVIMPAKHVAKTHNLPPWSEWDEVLVAEAESLMGDELSYFGYQRRK